MCLFHLLVSRDIVQTAILTEVRTCLLEVERHGSGVTPGEPSFNTTASINGVSQSIAGGSVTATAPITSVAVSGTNLGDVTFTAKVDGTGEAISPTSHDANGASFTGLNVAAGHSLVVYRGGATWFTITAQASGGTNEGD